MQENAVVLCEPAEAERRGTGKKIVRTAPWGDQEALENVAFESAYGIGVKDTDSYLPYLSRGNLRDTCSGKGGRCIELIL